MLCCIEICSIVVCFLFYYEINKFLSYLEVEVRKSFFLFCQCLFVLSGRSKLVILYKCEILSIRLVVFLNFLLNRLVVSNLGVENRLVVQSLLVFTILLISCSCILNFSFSIFYLISIFDSSLSNLDVKIVLIVCASLCLLEKFLFFVFKILFVASDYAFVSDLEFLKSLIAFDYFGSLVELCFQNLVSYASGVVDYSYVIASYSYVCIRLINDELNLVGSIIVSVLDLFSSAFGSLEFDLSFSQVCFSTFVFTFTLVVVAYTFAKGLKAIAFLVVDTSCETHREGSSCNHRHCCKSFLLHGCLVF